MKFIVIIVIPCLLLAGCFVVENPNKGLAEGIWRGELELSPMPPVMEQQDPRDRDAMLEMRMDEWQERLLPFLFEITYTEESGYVCTLINGEEHIPLPDVAFGYDKSISKDTLFVDIPVYNAYLRARVEGKYITGHWVDKNRDRYSVPFRATYGQIHRFTTLNKPPITDVSGRWQVLFSPDTENAFPAIGEFVQSGNDLQGTFLTETGDFRYLAGTVQGDKLYLSTFDGTHAFLFEGKLTDEHTIIGSFKSGTHYRTTWRATRNDEASLRSADSLTFLKPGYDHVAFSFPDTRGDTLHFDSKQYQRDGNGKVSLIQILGTWCPNCRDETLWLTNLLEEQAFSDLRVMGLGFEKMPTDSASIERLRRYKNSLNIPYPLALAGSADKQQAARALPALNHIMSFPTLIVIDKSGKVRKIHTGFSGPATSTYADFDREMRLFLKNLLEE